MGNNTERRKLLSDWRTTIWCIEVRHRNGRPSKWSVTGETWYSTRRDCLKAIGEIAPVNWDIYFYRAAKYGPLRTSQ